MLRIPIFQLLDSNLHIGHRINSAHAYNYHSIYCIRKSYVIFDLEQTVLMLRKALTFVASVIGTHGKVLFSIVTPAKMLQRYVTSFSKRLKQPSYCVTRWEGGFLTNWKKMRTLRIRQMRDIAGFLNPDSPQKRRLNKYKQYLQGIVRKVHVSYRYAPIVLKRIAKKLRYGIPLFATKNATTTTILRMLVKSVHKQRLRIQRKNHVILKHEKKFVNSNSRFIASLNKLSTLYYIKHRTLATSTVMPKLEIALLESNILKCKSLYRRLLHWRFSYYIPFFFRYLKPRFNLSRNARLTSKQNIFTHAAFTRSYGYSNVRALYIQYNKQHSNIIFERLWQHTYEIFARNRILHKLIGLSPTRYHLGKFVAIRMSRYFSIKELILSTINSLMKQKKFSNSCKVVTTNFSHMPNSNRSKSMLRKDPIIVFPKKRQQLYRFKRKHVSPRMLRTRFQSKYKNAVRNMFKAYHTFPDVGFLANPTQNWYVLQEYKKLSVPLMGVVDSSNTTMSMYTYPIFGNEVSIGVLRTVLRLVGHGVLKARVNLRAKLWRLLEYRNFM